MLLQVHIEGKGGDQKGRVVGSWSKGIVFGEVHCGRRGTGVWLPWKVKLWCSKFCRRGNSARSAIATSRFHVPANLDIVEQN